MSSKTIKKARLVTVDGRDVTDMEWRKVPDFPDYEMNEDADLRSNKYGELRLIASVPNGNSYSYNVTMKGKQYTRNYWKLFLTAFPEYDGVWKTIPGHPKYEVNQKQQVRGKFRHQIIKPSQYGVYRLRDGLGNLQRWRVSEIKDWVGFWGLAAPLEEK